MLFPYLYLRDHLLSRKELILSPAITLKTVFVTRLLLFQIKKQLNFSFRLVFTCYTQHIFSPILLLILFWSSSELCFLSQTLQYFFISILCFPPVKDATAGCFYLTFRQASPAHNLCPGPCTNSSTNTFGFLVLQEFILH